MLGDPLIAVRGIHFFSTMMVGGAIIFAALISEPIWRDRPFSTGWVEIFLRRMQSLIWISLSIAVATGVVRLVLVAADIANSTWTEVLRDGTVWVVLTQTEFGAVSQIRLLLAGILAMLLLSGAQHKSQSGGFLIALVAVLLLGSLAWTGHAAGAVGAGARLHLGSDILHILAAGAWIGGLVVLALLMAQVSREPEDERIAVCHQVLRRFSNLGVACVVSILLTGLINTWFLTDQMRGLTGTAYGQLVQIKMGLFMGMVALAVDNRLRLLPRLSRCEGKGTSRTLAQLRRNIVLEIGLAVFVTYVVGVLGVTPPAGHSHAAGIGIR